MQRYILKSYTAFLTVVSNPFEPMIRYCRCQSNEVNILPHDLVVVVSLVS